MIKIWAFRSLILFLAIAVTTPLRAQTFIEIGLPASDSQVRGITWLYDRTELAFGNKFGRILPNNTLAVDVKTLPTGTSLESVLFYNNAATIFTDPSNNKIYAFTSDTGPLFFSTVPTPNSMPTSLTAGPNARAYFTLKAANKVGFFPLSSSANGASPIGAITEINLPTPNSEPQGITFGADFNIWVALPNVSKIARISATGLVTEFSTGTAKPYDVAAGVDGNIWFTDYSQSAVGKITPSGSVAIFALPTKNAGPRSIISGRDGNLWFVEETANKVARVTLQGVVFEYVLPKADSRPRSLTFEKNDTILISAPGINKLLRMSLPKPALTLGSVFSSAQGGSSSFFRFYNSGSTTGTVRVTLADGATGSMLGQWTSPSIAPLASKQFSIATIESAISSSTSRPPYYVATLEPEFNGSFQHVLYRPANGTLTNLSTCDGKVTSVATQVNNVHSSIFDDGFPSSIVINNISGRSGAATLGVYNSENGLKLATYTTAAIPANGQLIVRTSEIEQATSTVPGNSLYHYNIKIENQFDGYLQHLVNNMSASVITDMTTTCALGLPTIPGQSIEFPTGSAQPSQIAVASNGDVWFSDALNLSKVGVLNPASGAITFREVNNPNAALPNEPFQARSDARNDLVIDSSQNVWFSHIKSSDIYRISATGTVSAFRAPTATRVSTFGSDGNIWLAHSTGIARLISDGTFTTFTTGANTVRDITLPYGGLSVGGIARGGDGNIWTKSMTVVRKFDVTASTFSTFVLPDPLGTLAETSTENIVSHTDGRLWLLRHPNSPGLTSLHNVTTSGEFSGQILTPTYLPDALISGADGNLWIPSTTYYSDLVGTGPITKFDPRSNKSSQYDSFGASVGSAATTSGFLWLNGSPDRKSLIRVRINAPTLSVGSVFSSVQGGSNSFFRFQNSGTAAGTVRVALADGTTGARLGQWTSPIVPAGASKQFSISDIESVIGSSTTKPAYYVATLESEFNGTFQHILYRPANGTLTNLSTCDGNVTSVATQVSNVHSSILDYGFPSSIVVNNAGGRALSAGLGIFNSDTGERLGSYATSSIPAGGQVVLRISEIEQASSISPGKSIYHYNIKIENQFDGYLQHLVNNISAGVITDMTTTCGLPIKPS